MMHKSTFEIAQMDCAAEEQLVRMKLSAFNQIERLTFDLPNRRLEVYHQAGVEPIAEAIAELNLSDNMISKMESVKDGAVPLDEQSQQRRMLWAVLGINLLFFLIEFLYGWMSNSMGLVADSLDMLADAFVYGLSLLAVGAGFAFKNRIAKLSGYLQMLLAILGLLEVIRRVSFGTGTVNYANMMIIALLALMANALCLYLLQKNRSQEVHMEASWIFTSNDIIINLGIILAGGLVYFFGSSWPDLLVGSIVFIIVFQGARRILKLSQI